MRLIISHSLIGIFILLLPATLLWAEDELPKEPPWYEFEIIIYANHASTFTEDEAWPADPGQPSQLDTLPLEYKTVLEREAEADYFEMSQLPEGMGQPIDALLSETEAAEELFNDDIAVEEHPSEEAELPIAYQQLPSESLQLTEAYNKLLKSNGRFEPLIHMAWRQQVESPKRAQTLYLLLPTDEAEQTPGLPDQIELPKLEGSLKVSIKRYLHVDFDLVLRRLTTVSSAHMSMEGDTLTTLSPHYQAYRMQMHRRMRSNELHYLDHPQIGVIITAHRYEIIEPEPEPETKPEIESSILEKQSAPVTP